MLATGETLPHTAVTLFTVAERLYKPPYVPTAKAMRMILLSVELAACSVETVTLAVGSAVEGVA